MTTSANDDTRTTAQAGTEEGQVIDERLEQTQRLVTLGTLAAGVAHEINNILTPVLSYAHLARSRPGDEALLAKALNKIISGVEAACAVAQSTLDFSSDREEECLADVGEVLEEALSCLARDPEKDGFQVTNRLRPQTLVRIQPLALQQVFLNLILNARTALRGKKKGPGVVTVEAQERPDGTTVITVTDNGPGIAADVLSRLFEPFVSTSSNQALFRGGGTGGAGLGLTVTRHLIEKADGTISVDSKPGRGARFHVALPTARIARKQAG